MLTKYTLSSSLGALSKGTLLLLVLDFDESKKKYSKIKIKRIWHDDLFDAQNDGREILEA